MTRQIAAVLCVAMAVSLAVGCRKKEEKATESVAVIVPPPIPSPLVAKGMEVYKAKCASCHAVAGVGGNIGPDLSKIGASRDALYIQTQLQDPKAYKQDSKMPSFADMPKEDKDALVAYLLTLK